LETQQKGSQGHTKLLNTKQHKQTREQIYLKIQVFQFNNKRPVDHNCARE